MNQNHRDTLVTCLTQIFGRVEDAFVDAAVPLLDWVELSGGETLIEEGDPSDAVYFVITGRLRASIRQNGSLVAIGEIGRGETVGEMGMLTGEPRSATVVAVRDTVLARASRSAFDELWHRHPQLPVHMARIIIERLKRQSMRSTARRPATICLLSITPGVDLRAFAGDLLRAIDRWGVTTLETSERIDERFGHGASQSIEKDSEIHHRVTTWLDDVEFWNEFVLLLSDDGDSEWTRRCLRHADEIVLVADADAPVAVSERERRLLGENGITGARQTLVLLHGNGCTHPTGTDRWLDRRPVDAHYHARPGQHRDIERLARIITGNAVGLVLGGGGARGFAHLGVYKALEEAGIEVDLVGGTSIGSAMSALISFDLRADALIGHARKIFARNPTGDVNFLPFISLIGGRRLRSAISRGILDASGCDPDVSDTWRTLYCVAANYSSAREMVIRRGKLARAVRASVSIPVALPPVVWDGELLVDGGLFNNFPTDVMAKMGARRIIGVDLSRRAPRQYDFDEVPGTWDLLWDRIRREPRYGLPTLGTVLVGTTLLYSDSRREQARRSADIYFNPELAGVGLLDWKAFDRTVDLGYRHAKEVLASIPEEELAHYRCAAP